jgi:hypothetical protein
MRVRRVRVRKELRDGRRCCCAIVTLAEQRDALGWPLWQAAADKVSFRDGLGVGFALYGL